MITGFPYAESKNRKTACHSVDGGSFVTPRLAIRYSSIQGYFMR